MNAKFIYDE